VAEIKGIHHSPFAILPFFPSSHPLIT